MSALFCLTVFWEFYQELGLLCGDTDLKKRIGNSVFLGVSVGIVEEVLHSKILMCVLLVRKFGVEEVLLQKKCCSGLGAWVLCS